MKQCKLEHCFQSSSYNTGIIDNFDLNARRLTSFVSTSSMIILPDASSVILNNAEIMLDLPAPVLPHIPILLIIFKSRDCLDFEELKYFFS